MSYIIDQLTVANSISQNPSKIKIKGKNGETKWLDITAEQLRDIEAILIKGEQSECKLIQTCKKQ